MALEWSYTSLKAAIIAWIEDDGTEFADQVDNIIGLGEEKLLRDADLDVFRKYAIMALFTGNRFLAKPSDFLVDRWMSIISSGERIPVKHKSASFIEEFENTTTTTGVPRFYADWDHDTFILGPETDSAYTVELAYSYKPTGLTSSNATTWLGTNAPDALLFACLIKAAVFKKMSPETSPMFATFKGEYAEALHALRYDEEFRQRHSERFEGERAAMSFQN